MVAMVYILNLDVAVQVSSHIKYGEFGLQIKWSVHIQEGWTIWDVCILLNNALSDPVTYFQRLLRVVQISNKYTWGATALIKDVGVKSDSESYVCFHFDICPYCFWVD